MARTFCLYRRSVKPRERPLLENAVSLRFGRHSGGGCSHFGGPMCDFQHLPTGVKVRAW